MMIDSPHGTVSLTRASRYLDLLNCWPRPTILIKKLPHNTTNNVGKALLIFSSSTICGLVAVMRAKDSIGSLGTFCTELLVDILTEVVTAGNSYPLRVPSLLYVIYTYGDVSIQSSYLSRSSVSALSEASSPNELAC